MSQVAEPRLNPGFLFPPVGEGHCPLSVEWITQA